jgi:hypothetical protein
MRMMNEVNTYIRCSLHNTIVVRSTFSELRMVHKKSGGVCESKIFILVRTEVIDRDSAFDQADLIALGQEAEVGAGNSRGS